MDYQPHGVSVGMRDVFAAWLVCLLVAAAGFAYPEIAASTDAAAVAANAAPRTGMCAGGKLSAGRRHG